MSVIDFIILFVLACMFAAGFWCGSKYRTFAAMKTAAIAWVVEKAK